MTQCQFNKLNEIALVLVRKIDTKTYEEMCDILNDIYKTDIAESEECAKEFSVDSIVEMYSHLPEYIKRGLEKGPEITCEDDSVCPRDCKCRASLKSNCTIRGYHKHTDAF